VKHTTAIGLTAKATVPAVTSLHLGIASLSRAYANQKAYSYGGRNPVFAVKVCPIASQNGIHPKESTTYTASGFTYTEAQCAQPFAAVGGVEASCRVVRPAVIRCQARGGSTRGR
jgi:hypothetical protein